MKLSSQRLIFTTAFALIKACVPRLAFNPARCKDHLPFIYSTIYTNTFTTRWLAGVLFGAGADIFVSVQYPGAAQCC